MFNNRTVPEELVYRVLSECPLFDGLTKSELKTVHNITHIRDYSADEKIFSEGTIGLCFYIVAKGSVEVISETTIDGTVKPKVLRIYKEGGFFSEAHLFSETNHTVSCVAKEVSRLIIFTKPDFEDLIKIKPKIGNKVLLKFLEFMSMELEILYKENKELLRKIPQSSVF
ncbi:MAG: cyclic nucleotide-binding domain-containing protein [Ignavibacteriae bacterium]|nr:MAG: cyclic nucleotide-binding domain-containing protein [Ignavibacteriota bacterium]